ncbi:Protocadherin [Echinococcus granulosus]|uniref:Protocadherin n=1 Tax=Echinococcus granulosus TaxID=6210 RepID=W6UJS8_ECHGR|nr:Protocadherin [Echinococcus granulosus]EUB61386.1 Protocadherin [Echinococcus granulosus]
MFAVCFIIAALLPAMDQAIKRNEVVMNASEGVEVGSTIGTLSSYSGGREASYLGMVDGDALFSIERDGKVVVAKPIDLETLCREREVCCTYSKPCQLYYTVMVEDPRSEEIREINLRIRIMDVNDHAPRFRQPNGQVVQVSEKAPIGTSIDIDPAVDGDWALENQIQRYALHGSDIQRYFEIDNSDLPRIQLKLREQLDYEKQSVFKGTLEACDRHNCTTAPLTINIIDVNDNLPFFHPPLEHNLTLPEDTPSGRVILRLNATDYDSPPNARMRFEFVGAEDPSISSTFHLDPLTGAISLARRLQADVRLNYHFKVRVKETSDSAPVGVYGRPFHFNDIQRRDTVSVNIRVEDINDFAPDIRMVIPPESSEVWVPENSSPGRIATLKVEDRDLGDNGLVTCGLDGAGESFELRQLVPSIYALHSRRSFDAEAEPIVFVNITCSDRGTPRPKSTQKHIVVRIDDENEFEPVFTKKEYSAKITENAPNNTFVLQVIARDGDQSAQLEYSLKGDGERYFKIDPGTGKITTMERDMYHMSRLDREMTPEVTFFVLVKDAKPDRLVGGKGDSQKDSGVVHTAQTTVTVELIDENDNAPSFTDIGPFHLSENHPKHSKVNGHLHAEDPDQGLNGKSLIKGEKLVKVMGEAKRGVQQLGRRDSPCLTSMWRQDCDCTVSVAIIATPVDVHSSDAMSAPSQIPSTWGEKLVESNVGFGGTPSFLAPPKASIVHNERVSSVPFTRREPFVMRERAVISTPFKYAVKYGLQDVWDSSNHVRKHNLFQLDETTGVLRALEPLDREQTAEYTLRVVACDMAPRDTRCTSVNVTVSVGDVNDNAPEWLFPVVSDEASAEFAECVNITTDAVAGQVVAQLVAHDRDAGQNGRVRYALHDPHSQVAFSVNATTGRVTVANRYYTGLAESSGSQQQQQQTLQPGVHRLRIRASDMGQPPQFSDTWLTIRVVGASSSFFSLQTGLLVLLVLVTLIIAVSLIVAIVCIRRQHSTGCKSRQQIVPTPSHAPSYILPTAHPHSDYPTFLKQSGSGPAYMLAKTTAGSVCSSDHCEGSGAGNCPITDLGVTEFYAPYGLATSSTQGDDQVRFVEVDPTGIAGSTAAYLSFARSEVGSSTSPGVRLVSTYHPVAYNTCDSVSPLPTMSSGNPAPAQSVQGMLKFRQGLIFAIVKASATEFPNSGPETRSCQSCRTAFHCYAGREIRPATLQIDATAHLGGSGGSRRPLLVRQASRTLPPSYVVGMEEVVLGVFESDDANFLPTLLTSGPPEFLYPGRGNSEEVFELPEASGGRYAAPGHVHTSHHHPLASSEQFEGGSADSGRGVSEDEPPPAHVIHCNGSSDCLPISNTSTFFCQNPGSLHRPSTFLGNGGGGPPLCFLVAGSSERFMANPCI